MEIETAVGRALDAIVVERHRLGGGDVAESFHLRLDDGRAVFAKTHRNPPPHFFSTEATGLGWLRQSATVRVPEVIAVSDDPALLVLDWIEEGEPGAETESDLGRRLARLHRSGTSTFGRQDHRTTGSRALPNEPCDTWVEFFATRRLGPLLRLAADTAALPDRSLDDLSTVVDRLSDLGGPAEPPALLHGDLWAGNRLIDRAGRSWLIDPAAHGGHREFDLAMMRLFGGYGPECFAAYDDEFPLADGWERRVPLHQLAPLTVHAIKFGGGYAAATQRALDAVLSAR